MERLQETERKKGNAGFNILKDDMHTDLNAAHQSTHGRRPSLTYHWREMV